MHIFVSYHLFDRKVYFSYPLFRRKGIAVYIGLDKVRSSTITYLYFSYFSTRMCLWYSLGRGGGGGFVEALLEGAGGM